MRRRRSSHETNESGYTDISSYIFIALAFIAAVVFLYFVNLGG